MLVFLSALYSLAVYSYCCLKRNCIVFFFPFLSSYRSCLEFRAMTPCCICCPLCPQLTWLLKWFAITHMLAGACLFNLWSKQILKSSSLMLFEIGALVDAWFAICERHVWSVRTCHQGGAGKHCFIIILSEKKQSVLWSMFFLLLQVDSSLTWFVLHNKL